MGLSKLLIAWVLSMAIYAAIIQAWLATQGRVTSGLGRGVVEGFVGLGILLAIPTFLFALVVGWPTLSFLANLRPALLVPLAAATVLAAFMWLLAAFMLPDGWGGVAHALVGYAAVLGLVGGCLNLATATAR